MTTNLVFVFRLLEKYARVDGILETLRAEGGTQEQIEEVIKVHFFFKIKGTVRGKCKGI